MTSAAAHQFEDHIRRMTPVTAPPEQRRDVAALLRAFETVVRPPRRRTPRGELVGPSGERLPIPESVFYLLERVVGILARGDAVTIVPVGNVVTTQQAANILNVSRQYLVRLLGEGKIPYSRTGKHRRLRVEDVLAYKKERDKDRRAGLRELSRLTQEFGGYDSELK